MILRKFEYTAPMKNQITCQEWLKKLIAFDTTSSCSNLELIQFAQNYLSQFNLDIRLTYDEARKKANLLATRAAEDGSLRGGLLLCGHTDVVPVVGQTWESDPFVATLKNDRIYGRGSCDMKGFIAAVFAQLPALLQSPLKKPLHIALSYDEEVGCLGAPLLIEDMQKQGIQPAMCIVGEPTEMKPVLGNKGIHVFRCTVHGKAAHSSLTPQGCNAIEYAARLICYLRQFADFMHYQGEQDSHFDVPFTTISTNKIQGGNALNTIPDWCEFFFEFRHLVSVDPKEMRKEVDKFIQQELLPRLQGEYPEARIELDALAAVPGMNAEIENNFIQRMQALTQHFTVNKVAYATEAGQFQQAGMQTIVCGPGNIEQAHRANEYVSVDQLERCERFLVELINDTIV